MIVAATGHRPKDIEEDLGVVELKARVKLQYTKSERLICGMADGFDLLAAKAAIELGLPITAARPWSGHKVSPDWSEIYDEVLDYADKVVVVTEADKYPGHWVMHKRNQWMVDNADAVMAYWNGKESGGTYECRKYAKKVGKPVANIFYDPPF
jgi:uncharacterized phage-like protein YoqJ